MTILRNPLFWEERFMKLTLRKWLSLLLAMAMLCALLPIGATATADDPKELATLVGVSRADLHDGVKNGEVVKDVYALAFRFRLNATGLKRVMKSADDYAKAKVSFSGETYSLVNFGALLTNIESIGNNPNALVKENVNGVSVTDVPTRYLLKMGSSYGEYVSRITNIPERGLDRLIFARPYFVYKNASGKQIVVYGDIKSANASGKKVRYSAATGSMNWTAGSLSTTTGKETDNSKTIRSDFINNTDLLVRLPADAKGTPTVSLRAYYYSTDELLSTQDITDNWTVLNDLGVPSNAVAVRFVAMDGSGDTATTNPADVKDGIVITANKRQGMAPLTFHSGGLSATTGAETTKSGYNRTGYLAVQDVLVKPSGCTFDAYYYDAEHKFLGCADFFMTKAKKVLDIVPQKAAYVRFLLKMGDTTSTLVPQGATCFRAYISGSQMYEDYLYEAEEEETKPTTATTTKKTTTTTKKTTTTTKGTGTIKTTSTTKATSSTKVTATTKKTTTTTKKTTTTTKKTTTTTKKTTTTTKPAEIILTNDKPENQGVQNALWNMAQMVNITYTPQKVLPQNIGDYPAKVQQKGIPYSSTRIEQAYVPGNVSFHTFMTALQNPNSYLYSVDLGADYGNKNGKTYYGAVCSTACGYALGIKANYTSYQWSVIPGMKLLEKQDLQELKLCDTIAGQGHVLMITGISRNQYGEIVKFQISEAAGTDVHNKTYTITALEEAYPAELYEYCRYSKISSVKYEASEYVAVGSEKAQTVSYNTEIIPRKGDKANWRTSETVVLDVLNKTDYTKVEIYKYVSGDWVKQETKSIASVIKLANLKAGTYKARLTNGTKNSKWCYWKSVDAESKGVHYQGTRKVKVTFSASNATPLYVQWMNGHTNATVRVTLLTAEDVKNGYGIYTPAKGDLKVRVAFETDYGIIYSELPEIITVE